MKLNFKNNKMAKAIWHELGHFIVDTLFVKENNEIEITVFEVSVTGSQSGGRILMERKNKEDVNVLKNKRTASYCIVSLFFGSILETAFLNKNLAKQKTTKEVLEKNNIVDKDGFNKSDLNKIAWIKNNNVIGDIDTILKDKVNQNFNLISQKENYEFLESFVAEIKKILISQPSKNEYEKVYNLNSEQISKRSEEIINSAGFCFLRESIYEFVDCLESQIKEIRI